MISILENIINIKNKIISELYAKELSTTIIVLKEKMNQKAWIKGMVLNMLHKFQES